LCFGIGQILIKRGRIKGGRKEKGREGGREDVADRLYKQVGPHVHSLSDN